MSLLEGGDRRRYNLPSHDEVAVVFVGEDGAPLTSREIVIYPRGHPLKIVSRHDCANVLINEQVNLDEINTFLDCRYVSAPEALWRIFEYPISHMSHSIIRLKVHLPENQIVYFREGEEKVALDRAAQRDTHLTAWFKLNSENEGANRYSYVDIPYHFVFDDKHCKWKVRQRGGNKIIVRMYKVSPTEELFFLKLLLLQAKGAKSWED
nr:uncharacterized protein LOC101237229 [Hydra vulgaris]